MNVFQNEWPVITVRTINIAGRYAWHQRAPDDRHTIFINAFMIDKLDRNPRAPAIAIFLFASIVHELGHYLATLFHGVEYTTPSSLKGEEQAPKGEMGDTVERNVFGGMIYSVFAEWENLSISDWNGEYEELDFRSASARFWDMNVIWRPFGEGDTRDCVVEAAEKPKQEWRRSAGQANAACGGYPKRVKKRRDRGPGGPTGMSTYGDVFR
jgi:hypothetical protein